MHPYPKVNVAFAFAFAFMSRRVARRNEGFHGVADGWSHSAAKPYTLYEAY